MLHGREEGLVGVGTLKPLMMTVREEVLEEAGMFRHTEMTSCRTMMEEVQPAVDRKAVPRRCFVGCF